MAIIKCKECKKEASEKAKNCPSCGAPIKNKIGWGGFIDLPPKKWTQRRVGVNINTGS